MALDITIMNIAVDTYGRNNDLVFEVTLEVQGHRLVAKEVGGNVIVTAIDGQETYLSLEPRPMSELPADLTSEETYHSLVYAVDMACSDARQAAESLLREQAAELVYRTQQDHHRRIERIRAYEAEQPS